MDGHPGLESVIVVLVVPEDRLEARKGRGREQREELRGSAAIIPPCAGDQDGAEEPQRVHQEMALTALHALAAVIPALRAADLGGLDRLPLNTDRARRGLTSRGHARLFASRRDHLVPRAVVTPLGNVVIGRTLGEEIVGQHIPLTTTPMEIPHRVEDFPPIDLARAPSSRAWLGGGSSGSTRVHCSSVSSEGYLFLDWCSFNIAAHSSAYGICAHYLINLMCFQALFPDSL